MNTVKEQILEYCDNWLKELSKYEFSYRKGIVQAIRNKVESVNEDEWLADHDKQIRDEVIEEVTEKYFDVIEEILHERDLRIELNQALTIYARIMNGCNKIAEQMEGEQDE